jgi:hypothetical protein
MADHFYPQAPLKNQIPRPARARHSDIPDRTVRIAQNKLVRTSYLGDFPSQQALLGGVPNIFIGINKFIVKRKIVRHQVPDLKIYPSEEQHRPDQYARRKTYDQDRRRIIAVSL